MHSPNGSSLPVDSKLHRSSQLCVFCAISDLCRRFLFVSLPPSSALEPPLTHFHLFFAGTYNMVLVCSRIWDFAKGGENTYLVSFEPFVVFQLGLISRPFSVLPERAFRSRDHLCSSQPGCLHPCSLIGRDLLVGRSLCLPPSEFRFADRVDASALGFASLYHYWSLWSNTTTIEAWEKDKVGSFSSYSSFFLVSFRRSLATDPLSSSSSHIPTDSRSLRSSVEARLET